MNIITVLKKNYFDEKVNLKQIQMYELFVF